MPDSKQLRILKYLTAHIEGITPATGYDYDLTGHVYRGKTRFGSEEATPFVTILEALKPDPRPMDGGTDKLIRLEHWDLMIQGWVRENRVLPTDDLYQLKAAVEKRFAELANEASPLYRMGGLIAAIKIGPGVVRAATPQVGGAECFFLPFLVTYAINLADPFA